MTDQLRFDSGTTSTRSGGTVTSTTDCGVAGSLRVELVLVERPNQSDVEIVRMLEGNRTTIVTMDALRPFLLALSKAQDCSDRRKARRAKP